MNRLFIRQIDCVDGDSVVYHDQYGIGRCSRRAFLHACPIQASDEDVLRADEDLARIDLMTSGSQFTVRDEANALTAFAFRNGFLEDLHAGKQSQELRRPGYSRISDEEMTRLMIEASAKLAQMLRMKTENPVEYDRLIRDYHRKYCRNWRRE